MDFGSSRKLWERGRTRSPSLKKRSLPDEAGGAAGMPEFLRGVIPTGAGPDGPILTPVRPAVQRFPKEGETAPPAPVATPVSAPPAPAATPDSVPATPTVSPALGLIVEDTITALAPGQMTKSQFLADLRAAVCATAEEALSGTIWSVVGCPWVDRWFDYYGGRTGDQIERAISRYAPEASGANSAASLIPIICGRVQSAIATWSATGGVAGVPEEAATPKPEPASGGSAESEASPQGSVLFKRDGTTQEGGGPRTIQGKLGSGQNLDGRVRSRMESAFGHDFSGVRVHTDEAAGQLSERFNARAFTISQHIGFGPGEYQPGNPVGDALIAHELAHTVQQEGTSSSQPFPARAETDDAAEEEADLTAVGAVMSLWGGAGRVASAALPRLRSGLRLQRCSRAAAPLEGLRTPEEKAAWITVAMREDKGETGKEIVKVFESTATVEEFLEIQQHLDIRAVIDYLDDWDACRVGSLGPVLAGADLLNRKRADYILTATHDFGINQGQVFTHFIFKPMYTDDMRQVLTLLAADRKIRETIAFMPEVQNILRERGLKLEDFPDRGSKPGDFPGGMLGGLKDLLKTSEAGQMAQSTEFLGALEGLPKPYQELSSAIMNAELQASLELTPGKVARMFASQLTLGYSEAVGGLVSSTIRGGRSLAEGEYGEAGRELTGAAIAVLAYLGVKAYARVKAGGTVYGPAGPGQFVIKGFTGPLRPEVARLGSILALNPEAQAAAGVVFSELGGQQAVIRAARWIEADSQAAILVYQEGLPGLRALVQAEGNVARARTMLPTRIAGQLPPGPGIAGLLPPAAPRVLATMKVTEENAAAIRARVARGEQGLDPKFQPSRGGAMFFVAEGNPYTGVAPTQNVAVNVSVRIPPDILVFDDDALANIQAEQLGQLFVQEGATLPANFAEAARNYLGLGDRRPANFGYTAQEMGISNTRFKRVLGPGVSVAERLMWDEVGRRVVASPSGVGRVVLGADSPLSRTGPGQFLVVRSASDVTVDSVGAAPTQAPPAGGGNE